MNLSKVALLTANIPILLAAAYGWYHYKGLARYSKLVVFFVTVSLITQSISVTLWLSSINNLALLHFYTPLSFALLMLFYREILKDYLHASISMYIIIGFTFLSIINSLFFEGLNTFNSNAITIQSVLLVMLSLSTNILLLNKQVRQEKQSMINSLNWFNYGVFIYHTSNIIFFYFGEVLMSYAFPPKIAQLAWLPHSFFLIISYVCFFIGLWKSPRQ